MSPRARALRLMALRDFTDTAGRHWTVWSVHPAAEIRLRSTPRPVGTLRDAHDMLRDGWLVFETRGERRRLVPIPDDWELIEPTALETLLARAMDVPARRSG